MIKIHIPAAELPSRKMQYYNLIQNAIRIRLRNLRVSLENLINPTTIDISSQPLGSINAVSYKLMKLIDPASTSKTRPQTADYEMQTKLFRSKNATKINALDLKFVINLLNDLDVKNDLLYILLTKEADGIKGFNDKLISDYSIDEIKHLNIIKLAFNYEEFDRDIASEIRNYYWSSVDKISYTFCPYCNLVKIAPDKMPNGGQIIIGTLDHFFNKDDFPLLSYSMFNLVPSCQPCNMVYKKKIGFTELYHLNPHYSGANKRMRFEPKYKGDFRKMEEITISHHFADTTLEYQQLMGDTKLPNPFELGNLNVFNILNRYNPDAVDSAKNRLDRIDATNKNIPYIKKHLQRIFGKPDPEVYRDWYLANMESSFDEKDFGQRAYSKFNRDMHDFYYRVIDTDSVNDFVRQINDHEED
ncbi:hypothetical protein PBAL39_04493 [Pedobacter sp. BAL39]|uniref:hypothetical protein n=1 Tax=Pedobacter sp. BAL39 TaxID=391596 RepID=UPI0001559DDD|nr:hypothetical protein [Pedobacter sp. BAL39]EDM37027.1 hypothetical protein PBAL39_04493 [Pedobacter sp. BAL39]